MKTRVLNFLYSLAITVLILGPAIALLVLVPDPSSAQTPCAANCAVSVGQGFSVLWDKPSAPGGPIDGYRIYLDNVKVGADVPAGTSTTYTVPAITISSRGAHQLQVGAFNLDSETRSPAITLTASLLAPPAPANLRILVTLTVAEDGSVSLKIVGVERQD